jgi:hypothetical protein
VTETNRIIKASADIKKGETCLFVPKKVMISQERMKEVNNSFTQKFSEKGVTEYNFPMPWAYRNSMTTLFLYEESLKGTESYWYHYFQTLPEYVSDSSIPLFF